MFETKEMTMKTGYAKLTATTQRFLDTCAAVVEWKHDHSDCIRFECTECGGLFENSEISTWTERDGETLAECPECKETFMSGGGHDEECDQVVFIYDETVEVAMVPDGVEFAGDGVEGAE